MAKKWNNADRKLLLYVCKKADAIVENKNSECYPGCYRDRNQYLVDHADYCIAYYDEKNNSKSGTGQTVRMAKRKGIPIKSIFGEKKR